MPTEAGFVLLKICKRWGGLDVVPAQGRDDAAVGWVERPCRPWLNERRRKRYPSRPVVVVGFREELSPSCAHSRPKRSCRGL